MFNKFYTQLTNVKIIMVDKDKLNAIAIDNTKEFTRKLKLRRKYRWLKRIINKLELYYLIKTD